MKKIIFLLVCFTGILELNAQTAFTALKLTPAYPKQNGQLSFEYNKAGSSLAKQSNIDIVVYQFNSEGFRVNEPVIKEKGGLYSGTVQIDSGTSLIAFGFANDEEKDINNGKGYLVPVYTDKNVPVQGYYAAAANFENVYGQNLFGLQVNSTQGLQYMEDGIKQYPGIKSDPVFLNTYLATLGRAKSKEGAAIIDAELDAFSKRGPLTEQGYRILIQNHTRNKRKEQADSLTALMKAAYPNGDWIKGDLLQSFNATKAGDKKVEIYNDYIKKYPPTEKDQQMMDFFKSRIANAYASEKNYTAYNEWNNRLDKPTKAFNNNNLAWNMAEADDNIQEAKKMAYDATMYTKAEMEKPSGKRPESMTSKQWEEQRKANYAMYGDTYAYILYKLGDYATALPISKEAATINKLKDAELNERYAMLAEKVLPTTEAKKLIEGFVENGTASSKTKESLKNLYIKENNGEKGFDEYMAKLEETAIIKKREEIAKEILNESSPRFALKDFEGKAVSLDELKGKVVVVDFWATWCGPCIASMPGMNKALTKYKDNPNVKFLFVDTWENADDKLKNAKAFMEKKKYPFYVLMDNDNKMVEDFKVSGIPTKFIIDKDGKIRFKAVGFNGNDDALVDELSTMIELASK